MWAGISAAFSFLANLLGWGREHAARKNAPAIQANEIAKRDAAQAEHIAKVEELAAQGNPAAIEELRRLNAE